jgi:hypothetical protein
MGRPTTARASSTLLRLNISALEHVVVVSFRRIQWRKQMKKKANEENMARQQRPKAMEKRLGHIRRAWVDFSFRKDNHSIGNRVPEKLLILFDVYKRHPCGRERDEKMNIPIERER